MSRFPRHNEHNGAHEDGFTLVELLIVVVILGILAGIVVFAVGNLTSTSVQTACQSDFKTTQVAAETYKAQVGVYPTAGAHGIPAAATDAVPSSTSNGLIAGDTFDTPHLGPWLRDQPTNGTHYAVQVPLTGTTNGVTNNGSGTVQVYYWNGASWAVAGGTGTVADCSNANIK